MAYTPKTWECGEIISADAMNNLEEGVQQALECCDHGYECIEATSKETLFEGNVTTAKSGNFAYGTLTSRIEADTVVVTFEGTEYEVSGEVNGNARVYGGWSNNSPTFTDLPFVIWTSTSGSAKSNFFTSSAGTYAVKVESVVADESVIVTGCFEKAVKSVVSEGGGEGNDFVVSVTGYTPTSDKTYAEIIQAISDGKNVYALYNQDGYGFNTFYLPLSYKETQMSGTHYVLFSNVAMQTNGYIYYSDIKVTAEDSIERNYQRLALQS